MVVDPRDQIKADLDAQLGDLRRQLAETDDRERQRAIKASIRQAKRDARRLQRTAIW